MLSDMVDTWSDLPKVLTRLETGREFPDPDTIGDVNSIFKIEIPAKSIVLIWPKYWVDRTMQIETVELNLPKISSTVVQRCRALQFVYDLKCKCIKYATNTYLIHGY